MIEITVDGRAECNERKTKTNTGQRERRWRCSRNPTSTAPPRLRMFTQPSVVRVMPNHHHPDTRRTLFHLTIELIFAVLPLLVLAVVWPEHEEIHPKTFWHGPEISMISCILYGLTISKLIIGGISRNASTDSRKTFAAGIALLIVVILLGLIVSVILINKLAVHTDNLLVIYTQYVNFVVSVACFLVFGGYGIRSSD